MKNLPKPSHLEIRIDEWQVAQGDPKGIAMMIEWRGVRKDPDFAEVLAALPPRADVPIRLPDGRIDLAPERWKHVRMGGTPVFKLAEQNWGGWGQDLWSSGSRAKARRVVTDMIRRYVPNFDDYTDKEQIDFIIRTQEKINEVWDSLEGLIGHLEYAAPDRGKAMPPLKNPGRDVRAAVFTAMLGSSRRAGKLLGIPIPPSDEDRHENETVRAAANRGRELLIHFFGETEWKAKVERMREYRQWWEEIESIDDSKEQFYAMLAKACGTSPEHERLLAEEDGFDKMLEEWVAAYEQKVNAVNALETFWQTGDDVGQGAAMRAENEASSKMRSIEDSDGRFGAALSLFERPPQG